MVKVRIRSIILGPPYNINLGKPLYSTGVTLHTCLSSFINRSILLVALGYLKWGEYFNGLKKLFKVEVQHS